MKALYPLAAVFVTGIAFAHPMGNLSVNHYTLLEPGVSGADITYVLDLAEIPTFELTQSWNTPRDSAKGVLDSKAAEQSRKWVANLVFAENGKALTPSIESTELAIGRGAANLKVFRITTKLHVAAKGGRFDYEDRNYPTRAGWREIVIRPRDGAAVLKASNGDTDLSRALTSFPPDAIKAPLRDIRAWLEWTRSPRVVSQAQKPVIEPKAASAGTVPAIAAIPGDTRPPDSQSTGAPRRTDAISAILRMKTISWPLLLTLIGLSFWFGALHALEPGHGKTMVAAYLVGERGTPKHAILLGGMVTFTHTISVFILGLATMFLSRYVMPDRISKVLGIISGFTIIWIGGMLFWRRARSLRKPNHRHEPHVHTHDHAHHHGPGHSHDHTHEHEGGHSHPHDLDHDHHHIHPHGQSHSHAGMTHTHDGHTHSHVPEGEISMGSLVALGASGGLVPCPSALILLLSAISLGRVGLGMLLLLSFSIGLALVLMATGMAVLYAKNLFPERKGPGGAFFRYMPVISAAAIVIIGVVMTSVSLGWLQASRFIG